MAQEIPVVFKEFVFPRTHKNFGEKVIHQTTPKGLRMLALAKENYVKAQANKKIRRSNTTKESSEPHEWNESPGPTTYKEFANTTFISAKTMRAWAKKFTPGDEEKAVPVEKPKAEGVLFPEIEAFDLHALIEFGLKEFPDKADLINKSKVPNTLRDNLRTWGKARVTA